MDTDAEAADSTSADETQTLNYGSSSSMETEDPAAKKRARAAQLKRESRARQKQSTSVDAPVRPAVLAKRKADATRMANKRARMQSLMDIEASGVELTAEVAAELQNIRQANHQRTDHMRTLRDEENAIEDNVLASENENESSQDEIETAQRSAVRREEDARRHREARQSSQEVHEANNQTLEMPSVIVRQVEQAIQQVHAADDQTLQMPSVDAHPAPEARQAIQEVHADDHQTLQMPSVEDLARAMGIDGPNLGDARESQKVLKIANDTRLDNIRNSLLANAVPPVESFLARNNGSIELANRQHILEMGSRRFEVDMATIAPFSCPICGFTAIEPGILSDHNSSFEDIHAAQYKVFVSSTTNEVRRCKMRGEFAIFMFVEKS